MIKYQTICSSLLKDLSSRTNNVIDRRFGLNNGKRETLEAIGKDHNITRERIRQIEEEGFLKIKSKLKNYSKVFQELGEKLDSVGGFQKEENLLYSLGGKKYQNHVFFLLTLGNDFERRIEDKVFHSFWSKENKALGLCKKVVDLTINRLKKEKKSLSLDELFEIQKAGLSKILGNKLNKNVFCSCLELSKNIQKNFEGEFGLSHWVEINPRGIKDKAYLILKKHKEPLHFTKVAFLIENSDCFGNKKIHRATVHNELIKDSRFVLVGRGLYALTEWGYEPGIVRDVILKVLKKSKKAISKDEIIREVSKQRFVKPNTILLNLQDKGYFLKDEQGRYRIKES